MALTASALALAQSRPALSKEQSVEPKSGAATVKTLEKADSSAKSVTKHTISGKVLGGDGKSRSGASVFLIGSRKPAVTGSALPKDQQADRSRFRVILAQANTDQDGVFSLSSDHDPEKYERTDSADALLLARAPGAGMVSEMVKLGTTGITLRLDPEIVIRGRLLAPSGAPAMGASVVLTGWSLRGEATNGMHLGRFQSDPKVPAFWPALRKTDAEGRFTLEGVPRDAFATLELWHPDYAVDEVTVNTAADGAVPVALRSFDIVPVSPNFTHALEPARPVQGRVTDKASGKPLGGILVQVTPMRRRGGLPFYARTDADGRYRISGHQADDFFMAVYPAADSGYLALRSCIAVVGRPEPNSWK